MESYATAQQVYVAALVFARVGAMVMTIPGLGEQPAPAQIRLSFALLLDPEKAVSRRYEVDNLPMTLLIDRNGIVRYVLRDYSAKSEDQYLRELRNLLNE